MNLNSDFAGAKSRKAVSEARRKAWDWGDAESGCLVTHSCSPRTAEHPIQGNHFRAAGQVGWGQKATQEEPFSRWVSHRLTPRAADTLTP